MATIKDVARIAGVSVATVSRVVNDGPKVGDKTRRRVRKIMNELGYVPNANARALVTRKTAVVGVVVAEIMDPFFALLAHGVEDAVRNQRGQVLLSAGACNEEEERRAIATLLEHRCDAMVVHSKYLSDEELIAYANQVSGFVVINRYIHAISERCVWLDNLKAGQTMANYMLDECGHKDIAVLTSHLHINDPKDRLEGVLSVYQSAGINVDNDRIIAEAPDMEGGERGARELLGKQYTALLCYNDAMAAGAMTILFEQGFRVPEDISIIGFDDILLSRYCRPKLTTLSYPIEDMAAHAASLALTLAKQEESDEFDQILKGLYDATLVKRESVKSLV